MTDPVKIVHLITGLGSGGAETMLFKLVSGTNRDRFRSVIISMTPAEGILADRIRSLGHPVLSLGMRPGLPDPTAIARLALILRRYRPSILQAWMYHADILGLIAGKMTGVPHILWNVRASDLDLASTHRSLRLTFGIHRRLAPLADVVLVNSRAGLRFHQQTGHRARRWELIQNGFDTEHFHPSDEARRRWRASAKIDDQRIVIGIVARFHPMKDHLNFLRAARVALTAGPSIDFVLAGAGLTTKNLELMNWIRSLKLEDAVHLLGEQVDTASLYPAFDIATLSSCSGEGMPNTLGEAMSCGVVCVATDVGDSGIVVGETGTVVATRDPDALAAAWLKLVAAGPEERRNRGMLARRRIEEQLSLQLAVERYERLYDELASCAG